MTREDAKRIIEPIRTPNSAQLDGDLIDRERGSYGTVFWRPHNTTAEIEGDFSGEDLIAIGTWMIAEFDPKV